MVNNRFLDVIKILLEHDDYITINAISSVCRYPIKPFATILSK